jgi:hypothetical protein
MEQKVITPKLFDSFVITGLPPKNGHQLKPNTKYVPQILYQYPPNAQ